MSQTQVRINPSRCKTLVVGDSIYPSAYDCTVTQQDLEKAYRELNEREEERDNSIRKLRDKLEKNKEFNYRMEYDYLLGYLRFRKFDIDKAYNSICKAHSLRMHHQDWFSIPRNMKEICNLGFVNCMPYRDHEGRSIHWVNFGKWKIEDLSFHEMIQLIYAVSDCMYMNPHYQISGLVCVWDFKGFVVTSGHLGASVGLRNIKTFASSLQESYPVRQKLIVFINCNGFLLKIINTMKFLFKTKIANRLKFLGSDLTELHQYVNPALLPKALGGTLEDDEGSVTDIVMENFPYLNYLRRV